METKELKTLEIKKSVEKINDLINPVSYAVRVITTGDIMAIFRYKDYAEKWIGQYVSLGGLEIVKIDLAGCGLLLNIKY